METPARRVFSILALRSGGGFEFQSGNAGASVEDPEDPQFQIRLLEAFDNFHRYFFIMPLLAQFELEVHQRRARAGRDCRRYEPSWRICTPKATALRCNSTATARNHLGDLQSPVSGLLRLPIFDGDLRAHALSHRVLSGRSQRRRRVSQLSGVLAARSIRSMH